MTDALSTLTKTGSVLESYTTVLCQSSTVPRLWRWDPTIAWPTQGQKIVFPRRGNLILYLIACRLGPDHGDISLHGTSLQPRPGPDHGN